jgi:putative addiction module killer protein
MDMTKTWHPFFSIDDGPGYRVYYMKSGSIMVVLLCGGDKRIQQADINKATRLAAEWRS